MHFPEFKYYKLDRDLVTIQDGGLAPIGQLPRLRVMHSDILNAAMTLLRHSDDSPKQSWVNAMLWSWFNWLPRYFFEAPASATHKYHPSWANRPDGLLLHSMAVCRVAASLTDILDLSDDEYNILVFASWHHDMFKYGELDQYQDGEMTVHEHPLLAGEFFQLGPVQDILSGFGIDRPKCEKISGLISTHAGPYRSSSFSDLKLPECTGQLNKLLFKADYIASRKEDGWVEDLLAEIP